jgi:hypothetical protein
MSPYRSSNVLTNAHSLAPHTAPKTKWYRLLWFQFKVGWWHAPTSCGSRQCLCCNPPWRKWAARQERIRNAASKPIPFNALVDFLRWNAAIDSSDLAYRAWKKTLGLEGFSDEEAREAITAMPILMLTDLHMQKQIANLAKEKARLTKLTTR